MKSGWFIIFIDGHPMGTQGDEPCGNVWEFHIVGPDGVKFIELIVQRVAAILGRKQDGATGPFRNCGSGEVASSQAKGLE